MKIDTRTLKTDDVIINLPLFKLFRLINMFNPESKKLFGFNVYHFTALSVMIVAQIIFIYGVMGHFTGTGNTLDEVDIDQLIHLYIIYYMGVFKLVICMYRYNDIWNLFDVSYLHFLTSERCRKNIGILRKYRDNSTTITNFLATYMNGMALSWFIIPILKLYWPFTKDTSLVDARFSENILNLPYPVSVQFYNDNFFIFYTQELTIALQNNFSLILFDYFFISFCYVMIAQYDVIAQSFKDVGNERKSENDDGTIDCIENYYDDFKSILVDLQKLYTKLKSFYSVIRVTVQASVLLYSTIIIINTYTTILIFFLSESLPYHSVFKLVSTNIYWIFQLYVICYLLDKINEKKENVRIGMNSCNWTAMDLKTRNLVLLAMRMEAANQTMIKITPNKIVDLQLFKSVLVTSYNAISVMLKMRLQNIEKY